MFDDKLNQCLAPLGAHLAYDAKQALGLYHPDFTQPLSLDIEKLYRRLRQPSGKAHLLRACLVHQQPRLLDITAGLGRDGLLLASKGCQVTLIERHPVLNALLADAIQRWQNQFGSLSVHLVEACGIGYLQSLKEAELPQVIYMDPMHPPRHKRALVKKELRIIRAMVGDDEDKTQLAETALAHVQQRLVVKWPASKPPLLPRPHHQLKGPQIRFDVYLPGS